MLSQLFEPRVLTMNQDPKNQNRCEVCQQSFNSPRELQDHKMHAHGQQQQGQHQQGQQQGQRQPESMKNDREKKTA
jgi:hypothetical protein